MCCSVSSRSDASVNKSRSVNFDFNFVHKSCSQTFRKQRLSRICTDGSRNKPGVREGSESNSATEERHRNSGNDLGKLSGAIDTLPAMIPRAVLSACQACI